MQLIMPDWEPSVKMFLSYGILILLLFLSLISILINTKRKRNKGKTIEIEEIMQLVLISVVLVIALFVSIKLIYKDVLYALDYKKYSISESEEIIVGVDYARDYCKIWTDKGNVYSVGNLKYGITEHKNIKEQIEKEFINKKCKIEFFKLSKYIHSIILIE